MTLDIHMPDMDGVQVLRQLGQENFVPAIMITALSIEEGPYVLDALALGAFDYIQKPKFSEVATLAPLIRERLKAAALVRKRPKLNFQAQKVVSKAAFDQSTLVVIGASTGGTEALRVVLEALPERIPPILIVQHIPPVFSKAFADRLNKLCPFSVEEAQDQQMVVANQVLVAPGGKQMKLVRLSAGEWQVRLTQDAPVNNFRPSVDYLFSSVAQSQYKGKIIAALLTGMGADGAKGLKTLRDLGARTVAQDEATSVVFGMPRVAIELGAAEFVLPLEAIGKKIYELCSSEKRKVA
jgi:two-component system chemotaxis response regulator CheB